MKKGGYKTASMGKWHLGFSYVDDQGKELNLKAGKFSSGAPVGAKVANGAVTCGFDSYLGFHHSQTMETVIQDDKVIAEMPTIKMLKFLGDHACDFIAKESKDEKPFFLYLAFNSTHNPIVPSEKWQGKSGMEFMRIYFR